MAENTQGKGWQSAFNIILSITLVVFGFIFSQQYFRIDDHERRLQHNETDQALLKQQTTNDNNNLKEKLGDIQAGVNALNSKVDKLTNKTETP